MELEEFKSAWRLLKPVERNDREVLSMIKESKHPVLKKIRRQLTVELAALTIFLLCYWSVFDGSSRHPLVNILLVAATLVTISYNFYGYHIAKNVVDGPNLQLSLRNYLRKMKCYALGSVISKVFYALSLIIFFTYDIKMHSANYYVLGGIAVLFGIQLTILFIMWQRRLSSLRDHIAQLY